MVELFPVLGHWFWWIIATGLLIGELILPGVFLLWLGFAAALVGLLSLLVSMGWQWETALFAIFSFALVLLSWRFVMAQRFPKSDQPNLNQRMYNYVGKDYTLEQPITGGRGKVRIDDTLWDIEGPDLPAGAMIHVTGVDGLRLQVKAHGKGHHGHG